MGEKRAREAAREDAFHLARARSRPRGGRGGILALGSNDEGCGDRAAHPRLLRGGRSCQGGARKVRACYRKETVNHTQNCADLVADYMKKSNAVIQRQFNQFKKQEDDE